MQSEASVSIDGSTTSRKCYFKSYLDSSLRLVSSSLSSSSSFDDIERYRNFSAIKIMDSRFFRPRTESDEPRATRIKLGWRGGRKGEYDENKMEKEKKMARYGQEKARRSVPRLSRRRKRKEEEDKQKKSEWWDYNDGASSPNSSRRLSFPPSCSTPLDRDGRSERRWWKERE